MAWRLSVRAGGAADSASSFYSTSLRTFCTWSSWSRSWASCMLISPSFRSVCSWAVTAISDRRRNSSVVVSSARVFLLMERCRPHWKIAYAITPPTTRTTVMKATATALLMTHLRIRPAAPGHGGGRGHDLLGCQLDGERRYRVELHGFPVF